MIERTTLKEYLLGLLTDESAIEDIELRFISDKDGMASDIDQMRHEIIESHLDNGLSSTEDSAFRTHFLIDPKNRADLILTSSLRKKALRKDPKAVGLASTNHRSKPKADDLGWLDRYFRPLAIAVCLVIVAAVGFFVYRNAFSRSDAERGQEQLASVYEKNRPVESRISNFVYAPFRSTRGEGDVDRDKKDRAELLINRAAADARTPETQALLGRLYLTDKKYDQSIEAFRRSLDADANDAGVMADLGAALLESAKQARANGDEARAAKNLNESLRSLDDAISKDPSILSARFNKALCLETIPLPQKAVEAWQEYLKFDSTSKWADEARRHLETSQKQAKPELNAAELEAAFLSAIDIHDDKAAADLIAENREFRGLRYIPIKLAMSLAAAKAGDREKYLNALKAAGKLEYANNGDRFAEYLADFYSKATEKDLSAVRNAHESIASVLDPDRNVKGPDSNIEAYQRAESKLISVGNNTEALAARYLRAYELQNQKKWSEGLILLNDVRKNCEHYDLKWLRLSAIYWQGGASRGLGKKSESTDFFSEGVKFAEEIKDDRLLERNLLDLGSFYSSIGDQDNAAKFIGRVLQLAARPNASSRQRNRDYSFASESYSSAGLYALAAPLAEISVDLAEAQNDNFTLVLAHEHLASAYFLNKELDEALFQVQKASDIAQSLKDPLDRERMMAKVAVGKAFIQRSSGDPAAAIPFYDKAIEVYDSGDKEPENLFSAMTGRLMALNDLKNDAELERSIPAALNMLENSRSEISDTSSRIELFDHQAKLYDVAASFQYRRGNAESAYDMVERSAGRSLLDEITKRSDGGAVLRSEPMNLKQIQNGMPAGVRLIQYSVQTDLTFIFIVTHDRFETLVSPIGADDLANLTTKYLDALDRQADTLPQYENELYTDLITPVREIINDEKDLVIIPDDVLFRVPFSALRPLNGKRLIEISSVSYAPSGSVFIKLTELAKRRAAGDQGDKEELVSVGDPAFDHEKYPELDDLPDAAREAQAVAALYPRNLILTGENAKPDAVRSGLAHAEVFHYAGHYRSFPRDPRSSEIVLAPQRQGEAGALTAGQIESMTLEHARLIVLSACDSGIDKFVNGEGAIGLSRTFFIMGAPQVVASQWKIDSAASARLMERFHFYRRTRGLSTARALRAAQLEAAQDSHGQFSHPYYWAAFAVYGGSD